MQAIDLQAPAAITHDAAEAVTEDEFTVAEQTEPVMPQVSVVQQKPLTDEQINQMWSDAHNDTSTMSLIHVLVRAVEAAHNIGEKK